jgi:hypothetical protein
LTGYLLLEDAYITARYWFNPNKVLSVNVLKYRRCD